MRKRNKKRIRHAATFTGSLLSVVLTVATVQPATGGQNGSTGISASGIGAGGANDPAARFRGAPTCDLEVKNVKWVAGAKDHSFVTFDVSWGHSWRAKWTEPAEKNVTGKPLAVESWDAVWLFVKYLPEKDSKKSIERNHWQHAMLSVNADDHVKPAGAALEVGTDAEGRRGMGVFIYRDAIGCGPSSFKGVKLRWQHGTAPSTSLPSAKLGTGNVDPVRAAIKVHALAMVYVPRGPFKVGSPLKIGISRFPDGPRRPIVGGPISGHGRPGWPDGIFGTLTDGAWRGGDPLIPFLVDAEWSGPVEEGSRARRFAPRPGYLWWDLIYDYHNRSYAHGVFSLDPINDDYPPATFHNECPAGYEAFYVMKYPVTQGRYAEFLNSLPPDVAVERRFMVWQGWATASSAGKATKPVVTVDSSGLDVLGDGEEGNDAIDGLLADLRAEDEREKREKEVHPPMVYTAPDPGKPCGWIAHAEGYCYAIWAGLRPLTVLEAAKLGRGPLEPAREEDSRAAAARPGEAAGRTYWGTLGAGSVVIGLADASGRSFRGTHGDGTVPPHNPGVVDEQTAWWMTGTGRSFTTAPGDWPKLDETARPHRGQFVCGRTAPAAFKTTQRKRRPSPSTAAKKDLPTDWPPETPPADAIKITNVKLEAGAQDYSLVTFDLAWQNSWRAKWTEPAEKNVTGKPLEVKSRDAAWMFVKFKKPGDTAYSHAVLSARNDDHQVPAGAALDVGLDDHAEYGMGVFIYRSAVGRGAVAFKNVKLRWLHPSSSLKPDTGLPAIALATAGNLPARHSLGDGGKPDLSAEALAKADVRVHAIEMVYVAEGPFKSKSPLYTPIFTGGPEKRSWGLPLPLSPITTAAATQPGGYFAGAGKNRPDTDAWPNGYGAFYCMKRSITQGRFVEFLNATRGLDFGGHYFIGATAGETSKPNDPKLHYARFYGLAGCTITTNAMGEYVADVPDRVCSFMSWPDIKAYASWAGLRPPTSLEYEKACRGPRDFAREEDAWTEGVCAPFDAAPDFVKEVRRGGPDCPADPGPSYWGIRQLSLSGCTHEWPGTIGEGIGRTSFDFKGSHGNGTPNAPADWPAITAFGEWFYMSWEAGGATAGFADIGIWILPAQIPRVQASLRGIDADRTGRYGAHAVRTAPDRDDPNAPLQLVRPSSLESCDAAILDLSGRFRNNGDKPIKVEVASALPEVCFPQGPSSRVFTAAPNNVTAFKVPVVLTPALVAPAFQGPGWLDVRLLGPDGAELAKRRLYLQIDALRDPNQFKGTTIGSLEGGKVALRLLNASDRAWTAAVEAQPGPGLKIAAARQRVELPAGDRGEAVFAVPPQAFDAGGVVRLPCVVTLGTGAPTPAETMFKLDIKSRWWTTRTVAGGPTLGTGDDIDDLGLGADVDAQLGIVTSPAVAVFDQKTPPKNWTIVIDGAELDLAKAGSLPTEDSKALAATRVFAPAEREVKLTFSHRLPPPPLGPGEKPPPPFKFLIRVCVDNQIVYELAADEGVKPIIKSFRLKKSGVGLTVECVSKNAGASSAGVVGLTFFDTKDGTPVQGLVFDMEKR